MKGAYWGPKVTLCNDIEKKSRRQREEEVTIAVASTEERVRLHTLRTSTRPMIDSTSSKKLPTQWAQYKPAGKEPAKPPHP